MLAIHFTRGDKFYVNDSIAISPARRSATESVMTVTGHTHNEGCRRWLGNTQILSENLA